MLFCRNGSRNSSILNHFGPKRLSKDPTPIEVEMRKYETDVNQALIEGHNRQDGKLDVK